jgi:hypothetical protein
MWSICNQKPGDLPCGVCSCSFAPKERSPNTETALPGCLLSPPACKASVRLLSAKGYRIVKSSFSLSALAQVLSQSSSPVRHRVIGMYVLLLGFNLLAWFFAFIAFASSPKLLLLALTAYTFGLRHAFDADHISAIDNVTRKLMQEKKQPIGVGFLGVIIVGLFLASWVISTIIYKVMRYDDFEITMAPPTEDEKISNDLQA